MSPQRLHGTAGMPRSEPLTADSPRLAALFARYLRRYLNRHFDAVRMARPAPFVDPAEPSVFDANHAAGWDPRTKVYGSRKATTSFPATTATYCLPSRPR